MPAWPARARMLRVRNTSRTIPLPLSMWNIGPSAVTIPAASCPRCCSTNRPSYRTWLTGLLATTPSIPHIAASVVSDVSRHSLREPRLDDTSECFQRRTQQRIAPRRLSGQCGQAREQHHDHDDQHAARKSEHTAEQPVLEPE